MGNLGLQLTKFALPIRVFAHLLVMLNNRKFIKYLQEHQANTSISASTARRMGPAGTIFKARQFLMELDLKRFHKSSETAFCRVLDKVTDEFKRSLPSGARHWGSARKFLNIFLRGCTYNKYLSTYYSLQLIEPWLEVPLDSYVVKGLKNDSDQTDLPRWRAVIHLTPEDSARFQSFATTLALQNCVNRVDLDLKFWRQEN